ncbi:hypothetical protein N1F89_14590 [Aquibium sp. A9E412]|uniref:hypothetical protein n=1 Tax=Aquibium sp. A9E412 TaxID=2976767 RepID=UPI0025B0FBF5|nr:hypothetical protein [Aquibium sp. A9E412]MDN2567449.1 hypothetical protein [Aquibium sp. A9E412]
MPRQKSSDKDVAALRFSFNHNPWDRAAIAVLAGGWIYFLIAGSSSVFRSDAVPFVVSVVLVAGLIWLLGLVMKQEAEIGALAGEARGRLERAAERERPPNEEQRRQLLGD